MKKRARTSVTNPFHDGHIFEYQPFNEARHPIPLELQQYGPTLIPQWKFLEMLDYRYIHILFLALLYSYDCTCIIHEVAAIAGEIIKNHADKDIEPPDIVQRSIATSNPFHLLPHVLSKPAVSATNRRIYHNIHHGHLERRKGFEGRLKNHRQQDDAISHSNHVALYPM